MTTIAKPRAGMFKPFSGAYINLVQDNISVDELHTAWITMKVFLLSLPKDKWEYRYAEDKWTLKEMLVHMIDTERIFGYRALRMGRNDKMPMPGFEQNEYVPYSKANSRSVDNIINEFEAVRMSTCLLFANFDDSVWDRFALVDNHPVSVRALLYLIVGHALHHVNVIKEKYLSQKHRLIYLPQ